MTLDQAISAQAVWRSKPVEADLPRRQVNPPQKLTSQMLRVIYLNHMDDWLAFARAEPRTAPMHQEHMHYLTGHAPGMSTAQEWIKAYQVKTIHLGIKTGISKLGGEMLRMRMAGADLGEIAEWCRSQGFDVGRRQVSSALMHERRSRR